MAKKQAKSTKTSSTKNLYTIHLIAQAAGELLGGLAAVAISQFPEAEFEVVSHPLQNTHDKLLATLDALTGDRPIVLHALADEDAKLLVRNKCVERRVPHLDTTGPLFNFISDCVGRLPQNDVSRLHSLDSAYQRRIEAMEFALEHDDGLGHHSLKLADVVIVGISRVSKSPTTLYLSSRGYKAANVSIAPELDFPTVLDKLPKGRVVAFTMQPKRLHEIRAERASQIGIANTTYEDLRSVIREVMAAEEEYGRRGWPILDVTETTIEQTAAQIIQALQLKQH